MTDHMIKMRAGRGKGRVPRDKDGFTDGERAFVYHYLAAAKRSATDAAQLAGYAPENRKSAAVMGCKLMSRPHVRAEIDRLIEERNERMSVTADDVLRDIVILKTTAELLPPTIQTLRVRREILKDLGEHVAVGAFRRQVGLSSPTGGPIETADVAALASLSDEELDTLERARAILDRATGKPAEVSNGGADSSGEGTPPESA